MDLAGLALVDFWSWLALVMALVITGRAWLRFGLSLTLALVDRAQTGLSKD